jgi:hypothetical protein
MVRSKGLEPLRAFTHQLLRLARLPIPPRPRETILAAAQFTAEMFVHTRPLLLRRLPSGDFLIALDAWVLLGFAPNRGFAVPTEAECHIAPSAERWSPTVLRFVRIAVLRNRLQLQEA